jgi:hypothetical protein
LIKLNIDIPYMGSPEAQRPNSKPLPRVLVKEEKRKTKAQQHKDFRAAVWERDAGHSRASGKPLAKSGADWKRVGEVHHVLARSTNPESVFDVSNGILMSKEEHALAETNCPNAPDKCLLDIDGPEDRGKPQKFTWHDINGNRIRHRVG